MPSRFGIGTPRFQRPFSAMTLSHWGDTFNTVVEREDIVAAKCAIWVTVASIDGTDAGYRVARGTQPDIYFPSRDSPTSVRRSVHPSRSSSSETPALRTSDQENGPRLRRRMSERAMVNAKIGPSRSGPRAISHSELTSTPTRANPPSATSRMGGTSTARSAAVPARSAISRSAPAGA